MRIVYIDNNKDEKLFVDCFGYEELSQNAHWGKGRRKSVILHYVVDGEGFFNGKKVKKGEGFYIFPDMEHEYFSSENKPWKYFFIILYGEYAQKICEKYIDMNENGIFEFGFMAKLLSLCGQILNRGTISNTEALSHFFMLMSYHETKTMKNVNRHIHNAEVYIKSHLNQKLYIKAIAAEINIDDRYLYNLFIKHKRISPKQYINDLKVERACSLLVNTSNSVSKIADSLGFDDVFAFSKFFSKKMGVSPTKYRKG